MNRNAAAVFLLGVSLVMSAAWADEAKDKAPMPQTRGMQGMDPALHDQPAKDPYQDCAPNEQAAAAQAKHPMPDTKGMKGMDPKAHTVECPQAKAEKPAKPVHQHKAPNG